VIDPIAAEKIDPQNLRRTVRALEVIYLTGERFSVQRRKQTPLQKFWIIGLTRPRQELYARIDARIEEMFNLGLVNETKTLLERGISPDNPNLSAIGYREVTQFIQGKMSIEEAKVQMKRKTREFVRRQANWFKSDDSSIHWYEMNEDTLQTILNDLRIASIIK
jgi:tRNA dimethylallyltransferase